MVLELHVLGPGFSLPSIDPDCLAAICYFVQVVPQSEWVLITNSSLAIDPENELPLLKHASGIVRGFYDIVQFLRRYSKGRWDLDFHLDEQGKADIIAFSSFLEATGRPLLDLLLFLTSSNYVSTTRPALSALFPWPLQYSGAPRFRNKAKARCQHLGLSTLDVDQESDHVRSRNDAERIVELPPSPLDRQQRTADTLLNRAQHIDRIRLDALASDFLNSLQALLGNKRYLLSETNPSSLDCLAAGYLLLAVSPKLPQPWLAEKMRLDFERLCGYVDYMWELVSDGLDSTKKEPTASRDLLQAKEDHYQVRGGALPLVSQTLQATEVRWLVLKNVLDSLPFIKHFRESVRLRDSFWAQGGDSKLPGFNVASRPKRVPLTGLVAIAVGLSAIASYIFSTARFPFLQKAESGDEPRGLASFGEAGSTLAVLAGPRRAANKGL